MAGSRCPKSLTLIFVLGISAWTVLFDPPAAVVQEVALQTSQPAYQVNTFATQAKQKSKQEGWIPPSLSTPVDQKPAVKQGSPVNPNQSVRLETPAKQKSKQEGWIPPSLSKPVVQKPAAKQGSPVNPNHSVRDSSPLSLLPLSPAQRSQRPMPTPKIASLKVPGSGPVFSPKFSPQHQPIR